MLLLLLICARRTGHDEVKTNVGKTASSTTPSLDAAWSKFRFEHRSSRTVRLEVAGEKIDREGGLRYGVILVEMENTRGQERHAPASPVTAVEKGKGSRCWHPHTE